MKNKNIIFIVVLIAIIGGLFLFNSFLKNGVKDENIVTNEDIVTPEEPQYYIFAPKQAQDTLVFVEKAVLPDGGYVVIYKEENGKPGLVVGASEFLGAGVTENFQVSLSVATVAGDTLYAILHLDDGDEIFDVSSDLPIVAGDGKVVFSKFQIVDIREFENDGKL